MTDTVSRSGHVSETPAHAPAIDVDEMLAAIPGWIGDELRSLGRSVDIVTPGQGVPDQLALLAPEPERDTAEVGLVLVASPVAEADQLEAYLAPHRAVMFLAVPLAVSDVGATIPTSIAQHGLVAAVMLGESRCSIGNADAKVAGAGRLLLAIYRRSAGDVGPATAAIETLRQALAAERSHSAELRATLHRVLHSSFWKRSAPLRALLARTRGLVHEEPRIARRPAEIDVPLLSASAPAVHIADRGAVAVDGVTHETASGNVASGEPPSARVLPAPPPRPLVVMVLETFDVGGLEKVVLDLSLRISGRGLDVEILVVKHGGHIARQARSSGLAVTEFGGDFDAMTAFIEHRQPAVAVRHHSYACHDVFLRVGTRVIEVLHNIYHWQRGNGTVLDYRRTTWRLVACSRAVQRYAVDHLGVEPSRISLIHNGIDDTGLLRPDREVLRTARRLSPYTIFLMTSHIWANKSHLALLSAFEDVHRVHPQARLVCRGTVGDADVAQMLHRRVNDAGLRGVVDIGNSADRRTISDDYAGAHAVVLPSIVEGFSISTLEATYFGLPLILSDTGGARDLLLDAAAGASPAGIIIDPPIPVGEVTPDAVDRIGRLDRPDQVPALARAMTDIVRNRDAWIDRGLTGLERIAHFHIDRTVEAYLELIEAALSAESR